MRDPGTFGTSDADIGEAANQMLKWAVDVPADTIKAGVRDHVVTLSGTVAWPLDSRAVAVDVAGGDVPLIDAQHHLRRGA